MIKQKIKKIYKLSLWYTFCILIGYSCVTEKQRRKICASCQSVSTDSVIYKEKTILKDTTIFVSANPVIQYIQLECDSNFKVKDFSHTKYNNGVKNIVTAIGGVLISECNTDSLKKVIQILKNEKEIYSKIKDIRIVTTNILTDFQKWEIRGFWVFVIIIIILAAWKIIRKIYF